MASFLVCPKGFAEEFASPRLMALAAKTDHKVTDEFMVARDKLILLLNEDRINLRCKGSKRSQIQDALKAARTRFLVIVRGRDTVNKTKYKVMTVARYKFLKGKEPKEAGEEWQCRGPCL